jgi:hypothetical protein
LKDDNTKWQRKPIDLTPDEVIMQNDFARSPLAARKAIWGYVEENIPIPNELKLILLAILQEPFKGKSTAVNSRYWNRLVKEVIWMAAEEGITQTEAIERVAASHGEKLDTLTRRYNDGSFKQLRKTMLMHLLQDAE